MTGGTQEPFRLAAAVEVGLAEIEDDVQDLPDRATIAAMPATRYSLLKAIGDAERTTLPRRCQRPARLRCGRAFEVQRRCGCEV